MQTPLDSLCNIFQVEIDGRVLGEGVGSTWDEARMLVTQLNFLPQVYSDSISASLMFLPLGC